MGAAVQSSNLRCRRQDCSCSPHLQTAALARKIRHQLILAANFLLKNLALFHSKDRQCLSDCKLPSARNVFIEGPMEGRVWGFFPLVNTEIRGLFHFKCMCKFSRAQREARAGMGLYLWAVSLGKSAKCFPPNVFYTHNYCMAGLYQIPITSDVWHNLLKPIHNSWAHGGGWGGACCGERWAGAPPRRLGAAAAPARGLSWAASAI